MTQTPFAGLLDIAIATRRNRERKRFILEPALRILPRLIYNEPDVDLCGLCRGAG